GGINGLAAIASTVSRAITNLMLVNNPDIEPLARVSGASRPTVTNELTLKPQCLASIDHRRVAGGQIARFAKQWKLQLWVLALLSSYGLCLFYNEKEVSPASRIFALLLLGFIFEIFI